MDSLQPLTRFLISKTRKKKPRETGNVHVYSQQEHIKNVEATVRETIGIKEDIESACM